MSLLLLGGCASDTMKGFVGQDVRALILAYGPPTAEVDMGNNTHAFQWDRTYVSTSPLQENTSYAKDKKGNVTKSTTVTGSTTTHSRCLYTFFARPKAADSGWVVVSFKEPSLDCELTDFATP